MLFNLNVIDTAYTPLDVSNITIATELINLTDSTADAITLNLTPGNTYTFTIPGDANAPLSTCLFEFSDEPALNFTATAGQMASGFTFDITPTNTITVMDMNPLSQAGETYDQTISVSGEDITITLDWGAGSQVFTGVNMVTDFTIPDNSVVDITVESSGLYTYSNQVTLYTNEITASVLMQPIITDNTDPDFRRVYPNFFTVLEPCSYRVHLYDGQATDWGEIFYDENDTVFSEMNRNTVFDSCSPATLDFTQTIHVHEIGGSCGSGAALMFDPPASWTHPAVTTTEYVPEFTPNIAFNCCMTVDEIINLAPTSIELWDGTIHDACDIATVGTTVLEYTITDPNGTITSATYTGIEVDAGPLADLDIDFTPTVLGTYTVEVDVTNCCETRNYTYTFDACMSWIVTNTNCNIIDIQNVGTSVDSTITYTINRLTDYSTFEAVTDISDASGTLGPGESISIDLVNDNLYTVDVTDNYPSTPDKEYIFLLDCTIKECKKDFLLKVLCDSLDECDKEARIELLSEFAEFKALEEIVYQKWDEWKAQQTIYDTFSINDIMEDVTTLSKAISSMKKICNECVDLKDEDCGCN